MANDIAKLMLTPEWINTVGRFYVEAARHQTITWSALLKPGSWDRDEDSGVFVFEHRPKGCSQSHWRRTLKERRRRHVHTITCLDIRSITMVDIAAELGI